MVDANLETVNLMIVNVLFTANDSLADIKILIKNDDLNHKNRAFSHLLAPLFLLKA
jgi:hypothetical protein